MEETLTLCVMFLLKPLKVNRKLSWLSLLPFLHCVFKKKQHAKPYCTVSFTLPHSHAPGVDHITSGPTQMSLIIICNCTITIHATTEYACTVREGLKMYCTLCVITCLQYQLQVKAMYWKHAILTAVTFSSYFTVFLN